MGIKIESPVERFPGTVTLLQPVPYPAYFEWERCMTEYSEIDVEIERKFRELRPDKAAEYDEKVKENPNVKKPWRSQNAHQTLLLWEAIRAMTTDWSIADFDIAEPRVDPVPDVLSLQAWLMRSINQKVILGLPDPN